MVPIGLDLSLASTGCAVWGEGVGLIRTDLAPTRYLKGDPIGRRRYIAEKVSDLIHAACPVDVAAPASTRRALVVIEASHVDHAVSKKTAIALAGLHTVVLDRLPWQVAGIVYVAPSTAKKHLSGRGGASKDQMIGSARSVGYQGKQTDEADAYGLAMLGHHLLGGTDHLTPHRQSCLAAVEWLVPLPETAVA